VPDLPRPTPVPITLGAAVDGLADSMSATVADVVVTGVSLDSRSVQRGDLYAALPGHVTHGARFAAQAVAAGAVAILTDPDGASACLGLGVPVISVDQPRAQLGRIAARVYGEPGSDLQLLAVTGTNGKTTVAAMVEAGLRVAGRSTASIGTVGVRIGDRTFGGARTTPEATDVHALLGVMRESDVESVVMEVSSIALDEHRVDGIVFDVAAFTNLTQDHLDYHRTMEDYFAAKAALFTPAHARTGLVGTDDEWGRLMLAASEVPTLSWSLLDPRADWHAVREGADTWVVGPEGQRALLRVPLPGAFNVANAICAVGILAGAGVAVDDAAAGIAEVKVPGRMEVASQRGGVLGIVDYAHSPDAVERVLRSARDEATGGVIAVLGAGGDRDSSKRAEMGRIAGRLADVFVVTDDNPRSEDPAAIRRQVREGAFDVAPAERAEVLEVGDRADAVTVAVDRAESGDIVLVLGKGHEQGQEIAGVVTPFDDRAVLRDAMARRWPEQRPGEQSS
jgi:UDP-N-acetylmuramoyl-L-alanyl-D-glutamate--2,6-diaminopimelate ligase